MSIRATSDRELEDVRGAEVVYPQGTGGETMSFEVEVLELVGDEGLIPSGRLSGSAQG